MGIRRLLVNTESYINLSAIALNNILINSAEQAAELPTEFVDYCIVAVGAGNGRSGAVESRL